MNNDDLILILDDDTDLTLEDDYDDTSELVDDIPHAQRYSDYTGMYVVSPLLIDEQELRTKDKRMTDNVRVLPINEQYILNQYGGITAIIG